MIKGTLSPVPSREKVLENPEQGFVCRSAGTSVLHRLIEALERINVGGLSLFQPHYVPHVFSFKPFILEYMFSIEPDQASW
jgi:hypothetical protein